MASPNQAERIMTPSDLQSLPEEPVASPSEIDLLEEDLPWYKPSLAETAKLLGWRWGYFVPPAGLVLLVVAIPWHPFLIQLLIGWFKLWIIIVALPVVAFINAARHATRNRRDPFCIHCGYSLIGLQDDYRCPECGRPYNFRLIEEYRRDPAFFIARREALRSMPEPDAAFMAGPKRLSRRSRDGT
jgi:hypothetical protein